MKPIAGSVVSSKPASLSKAASILSRFVASDTGAHQDVSAFLRRASEAFDELVEFHRDLRARPEGPGDKDGDEVDRKERRKKKKKEAAAVEAAQDGDFVETDGDPGTSAGRRGGGALGLKERKSGSREKKRANAEVEGGVGNVVGMESGKSNSVEGKRTKCEDVKDGREGGGGVEDHSERRRKKKRKKEEDAKEGIAFGAENHEERHHKKKRKVREESL